MFKTGDSAREMFSSTFQKGRNSLHENTFRNDSLLNTFNHATQKKKDGLKSRKFSEGSNKHVFATP